MSTRTAWTAAELLTWDFPEPKWAVPDLLAEGANLLVGPPKVGKSWLSLNLAVSIASGGIALGKIPVDEGDVLYLALEDTGRRLKSRLRKVLAQSPAPERLTFTVACERLSGGGMDRITGWLDDHPDARLVVVDVLARVRDRTGRDSNAYEGDYAAVAALKGIADRYGVCILIVHHTRKMESGDFVDAVSGTQGLSGAADAILVLKRSRTEADAELHVTGRDIEEMSRALRFSPDLGTWTDLDTDPARLVLSDTRRRVVDYLTEHGSGTPKEIAAALVIEYNTIKQQLWKMSRADQVDTDGRGSYFLPITAVTPVTQEPLGYDGYEGYGDTQGGAA